MYGHRFEDPLPPDTRKQPAQDLAGNPLSRNPRPGELSAMSNPKDHARRYRPLELDREIDIGDCGSQARCHRASADGGDATHQFGSW